MFKNRVLGLSLLALLMFIVSCKEENKKENTAAIKEEIGDTVLDTIVDPKIQKPVFKSLEGVADTTFVRLADYSDGFAYDLRYATKNNFLKEKVYDCGECYTRAKTVKALLKANEEFKKHGVKIKFYDCYRPNSVQYKMWKIVPNPQYVANPVKGSIHNKGGAVDITLVTLEGEEVKMPTDFD
ncbi:MAG: M15 family metallopeptidase, partial [Flavobacteriaceae bacterium]